MLLGKRTTNCLSCGKGGENGNNQIYGRDGRVYKGTPGATDSMRNIGHGLNIDSAESHPYTMYEG